jgi:hypothetical protein
MDSQKTKETYVEFDICVNDREFQGAIFGSRILNMWYYYAHFRNIEY